MSDAAATPARIDPSALLRDHPVESAFLLVAALLLLGFVLHAWFPAHRRFGRDEIVALALHWRIVWVGFFLLPVMAAVAVLAARFRARDTLVVQRTTGYTKTNVLRGCISMTVISHGPEDSLGPKEKDGHPAAPRPLHQGQSVQARMAANRVQYRGSMDLSALSK